MALAPFSLLFIWLNASQIPSAWKEYPGGAVGKTIEAAVVGVTVNGAENNYSFNISIKSDDTGCGQYADWWEIIDTDGRLIYRRILGHSHVEEQPFTRSGGPVAIDQGRKVFIRGHMNKAGYGKIVYAGSVAGGFAPATLDPEFAISLENSQPLPSGCAF